MSYERVVSKAWQITWKNKYLWLFGFLAALTLGGGDSSNPYVQGGAWLFQNVGNIVSKDMLITLLAIGAALVFWFLGLIARSSVIYEVSALDAWRGKPLADIGALFQAGSKFLPRVLMMQLVIWFPVIVLNVIGVLVSQSVFTTTVTDFEAGNLGAPGFWGAFGAVGLLGIATVLLTIPIVLIDALGYRAIVLEGMQVVPSIRRAWEILKENLVEILILGVILLILGFLFSLILGVILSPLLIAIMTPLTQGMEACTELQGDFQAMTDCVQQIGLDPLFVALSVVGSIIAAALSSVWVTFQSSAFTLAYRRLTKAK